MEERGRFLIFPKKGEPKTGLLGALAGAALPLFYCLARLAIPQSDAVSPAGFLGATATLGLAGFLSGSAYLKVKRYRAAAEENGGHLSIINSIAETANNTRDVDSLVYFTLKESLSLPFLDRELGAAYFRRDEGGDALVLGGRTNYRPDVAHDGSLEPGRCICGKAASTGEVVLSECCSGAARAEKGPCRRLAVPVSGRSGCLGVICYGIPKGRDVSAGQREVLKAVGGQLAMTLENMRLASGTYRTSEDLRETTRTLAKKMGALNSLVEVDRIILSTMDRDEMLFKVSVQIRSLVPADVGGVALQDPETGDFRYIGGWGMEIKSRDITQSSDWLGNPTLTGGRPFFRRSLAEEIILSPFDRLLQDIGVRSDLYTPIMRKGRMVGIFFLGCFREGVFTQEDVETASTFASRMGIALEHARLIYDLDEMSVNIIHALASAIDAKSSWTKGHSERVSDYARALAERMGTGKHEIERLRLAGLLHDIGKIGTYDILLEKAGRLTQDEWELIKLHPSRGCEILEPIPEFRDILPAVRHHHERWDGAGYPSGLKGEEIPWMARVLCVADAFDTMTADRPYRPSIGVKNAVQELSYCSGKQFAPDAAKAFIELVHDAGMDLSVLTRAFAKSKKPLIWGTS